MGSKDITTTPYMSASNHTLQGPGNSTAPLNLPLVVGLSVGLPLVVLAITALVLGLLWACRTRTGSFQPPANTNTNTNVPKNIHDYPSDSAAEPVYQNYQGGGNSQPPATDYRSARNDYQQTPRRADPGDTAIYANVPSTFPSRT